MSRQRTYQIVWEGRDLFESADSHIVDPFILAVLDEGVIDLT